MKATELKDIVGYLPYGLIGYQEGHICRIDMQFVARQGVQLCNYKPVLRPMFDLTKEIIHRGKKFVPMVEIGKLLGFDNLKKYEIDGEIQYGFETHYADDAQGYTFGWHQAAQSLGVWYDRIDEETQSVESLIMNLYAFDKLAEWMFDYRDLIGKGLAIDVSELNENPYKITIKY